MESVPDDPGGSAPSVEPVEGAEPVEPAESAGLPTAEVAEALSAVEAAVAGGETWARAIDDLAEAWLDAGYLDRAIETRSDVVEILDPALRSTLGVDLEANRGVDLMLRYRQRGDPDDLIDACAIGELVWSAASAEDRLRAAVNLAGRLAVLSELPGMDASLERARMVVADALAAAPLDDPTRPLAVSGLAAVLLKAYQRHGDREALERGYRQLEPELEAVGAAFDGGVGAANLLSLVLEIAEETSDLDLLDQAEQLARTALSDAEPEERSELRRLLATALHGRYAWRGDTAALVEASGECDAAVREAGEFGGTTRLARAHSTRAVVRAELSRLRGGSSAALDGAIDDARIAHTTTRPVSPLSPHDGHSKTAEYANHLAMLLAERYDLLGDSTDLDDSIDLLDAVLADGPAADEADVIATNQANSLLSRFERDGDDADLERGIALIEAAIRDTGPGSVELAARHDTAGRLRSVRARRVPGDLDAAEQHAAQAVECCPEGSPDRAHYLNNWAMWVTDRWKLTRSQEDLDRAIALLERAYALVEEIADAGEDDDGEPERGSDAGQDADRQGVLAATIAYNLGVRLKERFDLGRERGHEDLALLQRVADLLDEVLFANRPHLTVYAGARLGDIAWQLSLWPEGEHAFRLALAAAGELSGLRPQRADKERARSGVQGLGALAALCAARAGDLRSAALHLEQASATLVAEAIGVRAEHATFEGIVQSAARMRRHILLLGVTPALGVAVLVAPDGSVRHAELPGLTEETVAAQVGAFRAVLDEDAEMQDVAARRARAAAGLVAWTTATVLLPLEPLLADVARLAILPLGRLAWLPITAAGLPGQPAVLADLEPVLLIRAAPTQRAETATAPPPGTARRVVVWADTGPPGADLPAVVREARRVARRHPGAEVRVNKRSSAQPNERFRYSGTLENLFSADLVHLACHCEVDADRPQNTVLHVQPPIRVGVDLTASQPRNTHVVLSACDAALTAQMLPDEALSAATAFLLAGAGIVTAPLWPVSDAAAPALMEEYHGQLAKGVTPARAMAAVQRSWAAKRSSFVYALWVVGAWPDALSVDDPV